VIEIINVSKKFRIWEDRSRDLKETTINFLRGKKRSFRDLWALREINLKIKEGETLAFIGENGSGKSTLLKLLGGIYIPDGGKIATQGKISSLLELGVGFHPDLTGEENIYLNGAMLGFDRKEMKEKFDEIVSFSEIGDFIYSPIRTYSSGMVMRLGFSVAMCVDPDILLIDEVLAVGDEAFQNKCFNRLEGFKASRKTLVLVTHSMEMVRKFCSRAVLLHQGRLVEDGDPFAVVDKYHEILSIKERDPDPEKELEREKIALQPGDIEPPEKKEEEQGKKEEVQQGERAELKEVASQPPQYQRYGTLEAEVTEVLIKSSEQGKETDTFFPGEMVSICLHIRCHQDIENPNVGIAIVGQENGKMIVVYSTNTLWRNINLGFLKRNTHIEVEFIQRVSLPVGGYYLTVAITNSYDSRFYDWHENLKSFQIKKVGPRWEGTIDLNSQIIIRK
jgi:ABC-2 type transport system ATP-binding protein/lipopolysaccharide transport system ATP-binding protein